MNCKAFYGTSNQASLSYLEFGAIDLARGTKAVWDFRTNQKAYDWLMLARYANDMAAYLDMIEAVGAGRMPDALETYRREVHHHDDFSVNMGKLLAVTVCSRTNPHPVFFELGQTLFGCIEGMECCRAMATALKSCIAFPDLKDIIWHGIDISRLFNRFAVRMHPGYAVTVGENIACVSEHPAVLFAKGVTLLYAIRSLEDLFTLLERSEIAVFDYSLSTGTRQEVTIGTGKTVVYLPLDEFMRRHAGGGKKMYVKTINSHYTSTTNRILIDGIYGKPSVCNAYIELDLFLREAIGNFVPTDADRQYLLDTAGGRNSGWLPLEDYIDECIPLRSRKKRS